jgi:hypothetical protein
MASLALFRSLQVADKASEMTLDPDGRAVFVVNVNHIRRFKVKATSNQHTQGDALKGNCSKVAEVFGNRDWHSSTVKRTNANRDFRFIFRVHSWGRLT